MFPMLPLCDSRAVLMPMNPGMLGAPPAMVPMMPMAAPPLLCPPNNFNLFSTTTMTNEYDSHMYGRFRHVEREHPQYRHAPFDWYRPPKQYHNIVHEDAAVVTNDGPVPIGDFYRYYIYGDDEEYGDDYDDDDDEDSSSFESDDYGDDIEQSSYEPRSVGYRRGPRLDPDMDDVSEAPYRPAARTGPYTTLNSGRSAPRVPPTRYQGNRTLAGDDDFDDAASVNSTYGN